MVAPSGLGDWEVRGGSVPEKLETGLQETMLGSLERGIVIQEGFRGSAGFVQEAHVKAAIEPAHLGKTTLAGADELTGTTQFEVFFGEDEPVVGLNHHVEACFTVGGEIVRE